MTGSLIALLSIIFGILGSVLFGRMYKKYSLGFVANTIPGVFGSVLMIKTVGRTGFDPQSIIANNPISIGLVCLNLLFSFLGGILALWALFLIRKKFNI